MPISKEDALRNAVQRDSSEIAVFCKKIDGVITERAGTGSPITVAVSGVPSHIVELAIAQYQSVGWDCQRVNDQRDGDYLRLQ